MKLAYLANIRLPTEKAHGLQITQMCEAFSQAEPEPGAASVQVTLYAARRVNSAAMNAVTNIYEFYGVDPAFAIKYIPSLDLHPLSKGRFERLAFGLQTISYLFCLWWIMLFQHCDVYYSRDLLSLIVLSIIKPRPSLVYEAHQVSHSRVGVRLQRLCVRRAGLVVAVTGSLGQVMHDRGARRVTIEHDGVRARRFQSPPSQANARQELGLPADAFLIGYIGRLHTMGMAKGIDTLIDAIALLKPASLSLYLVGGPTDWVERYRQQWIEHGLLPDRFLVADTVPAAQVPIHLAVLDVCALPMPWTEHMALYASPLKLFEYMAAERPILASNLPSIQEVVRDGQSALLAEPGNPASFADAIRKLHVDPALRAKLAEQARRDLDRFFWSYRAERILSLALNQAAQADGRHEH